MTWAVDRRLDFIDWCLLLHGRVNRRDLIGVFGISRPQAAVDFDRFQKLYPGAMVYDLSLKAYVPEAEAYETRRGLTNEVLRALSLLSATGHPMAWTAATVARSEARP